MSVLGEMQGQTPHSPQSISNKLSAIADASVSTEEIFIFRVMNNKTQNFSFLSTPPDCLVGHSFCLDIQLALYKHSGDKCK